jgi:hypothetical protein
MRPVNSLSPQSPSSYGCNGLRCAMYLDARTDFETTILDSNSASQPEDGGANTARLLINVCIAFAVVETLFVIAFILSWHFNRENNSSNTKGVYALILAGYIFCFGGVIIGIC